MTYWHAIEIAAPVRRVFDLLENPEKQKLWMVGLEETVLTSRPGGSSPVGRRFVQRMRRGRGTAEFAGEITAYEKPHRLAIRIGNAAFSAELDYRLEQIDGRTRLACAVDVVNRTALVRITEVLMRGATRRMVRKQLRKLKAVAQARS